MTLVGGALPRGRNGTLSPMTARKRSGRRRAACQATVAPPSWPTTPAGGATRRARRANGPAPGVTADAGGRRREPVEEPHHVSDQVEERVLADRLRPVALAVA